MPRAAELVRRHRQVFEELRARHAKGAADLQKTLGFDDSKIVILASIPTSRGRGTATSFMSSARGKGLSSVSLLNSSNRRPLRGGYWVVYTGPYASLAAVSNASSSVHGKGYSGAYVRELVVYKPKAK